jgi:hypothetical protein
MSPKELHCARPGNSAFTNFSYFAYKRIGHVILCDTADLVTGYRWWRATEELEYSNPSVALRKRGIPLRVV